VAQALGRLLLEAGEPVVALAGRDIERAMLAARFVGGPGAVRVVQLAEIPALATRVLIAVNDEAITPVADRLAASGFRTGVALHTCGARGPEALAPLRTAGVACGMLHPLQTFASAEQAVKSLAHAAFGLLGDDAATAWAEHIVATLQGRVLRIKPGGSGYYHAGAVMASGGLVAAIDAATVLLERAGIARETALHALGPLARTSLDNALRSGPGAALTGPVVRGDTATVAAHLHALGDVEATIGTLYRAVTAHLLQLAHERGLPESGVRTIQALLDSHATALGGTTPVGTTSSETASGE
jgi:predicted short-subunit dehydrogenase-like oxidoreductase (DUF2520 family)